MLSKWLELLAAWLRPRRDLAWPHNAQTRHQDYTPLDWDGAFPREYADDEGLILYAALVATAHY